MISLPLQLTTRFSHERELYPYSGVLFGDYSEDKNMAFRIFRAQIIFLLICPLLLSGQTNQPSSNVEIFQRLAHAIVCEAARDAGVDSLHGVVFRSRSENGSGDWLVENAFIRYFLKQNIPVQMANDAKNENALLFEFYLTELKISYQKAAARKQVTRRFSVKIDVRVSRGQAKSVVLLKSYVRKYQDTIPVHSIEQVESARYPFTHADFSGSHKFWRWINPVVILASTSAVIYSFFALRSK
ncbi:MAG: hypothetical protein GXO74_07710 [Calditrichaeota bacterium]|nr:hypothetical protein [Calditrichota bacterium]